MYMTPGESYIVRQQKASVYSTPAGVVRKRARGFILTTYHPAGMVLRCEQIHLL
ncbi:hypothetical protein CLV93_11197 [Prolixibacter denitrificans]|uniref:Uncharacterized protein n=1 Tax=Prolixibacter denitrificans TaxID=1541063 RepID=A0A2P8C821_9BACT|nr:hypothetical protein CLV93_11197 [Prolixibacter denitrificans]